jgi:TctA family transporter
MDVIPAVILGLALGLVGLFPGFHFSMFLLMVGPWIIQLFSLAGGILCMSTAVCVARCMHTLSVVYHPINGQNLASADPAQRMAALGKGKEATEIMVRSLWISIRSVAAILLAIAVFNFIFRGNLIKDMTGIGFALTIPAVIAWAIMVIVHARKKETTVAAMVASGVLGIFSLMSPSVEGSQHAITPLLTGLFAFPVLLSTIMSNSSSFSTSLSIYQPNQTQQQTQAVNWDLKLFGLFVGFISVMLPGLGTSSLVSTGQKFASTDEDYLTMASFAESTSELLALILGIMGIASRSSDAAIIQQIVAGSGDISIEPPFIILLVGVMLLACFLGIELAKAVSEGYRHVMQQVPVKTQAMVVAVPMMLIVWFQTGIWGMLIVAAGTLIHLGVKKHYVSNQVFYMSMVAPMVLSILGFHF